MKSMKTSIDRRKKHAVPAAQVGLDEQYSRAAELAWDYCKQLRFGEHPSKQAFYAKLLTASEREEFDTLVTMNEFIEQAVEHSATEVGE